MWKKLMFMIPIGIGAILIFSFVGGTIVQLLWNWLMPALFGVAEVTFWQGLGLLALCRILFGGMGRHGRGRSDYTPEQRARFRAGVRKRFGFDPSPDVSAETRGPAGDVVS